MTDAPPDADICFIDTETTSLAVPWAPHGRRVWEFAGVRLHAGAGLTSRLHIVIADVSLADANPDSLQLGGFFDRHPSGGGQVPLGARYMPEEAAAQAIAEFTRGSWLSGANAPFDEANLAEMLVRRRLVDPTAGTSPFPWHHHTYDVLAYAAGHLGLRPPWGSQSIAEAIGVPRDAAGKAHEALADAEWCFLVHERIHDPEHSALTALMDVVQDHPA